MTHNTNCDIFVWNKNWHLWFSLFWISVIQIILEDKENIFYKLLNADTIGKYIVLGLLGNTLILSCKRSEAKPILDMQHND